MDEWIEKERVTWCAHQRVTAKEIDDSPRYRTLKMEFMGKAESNKTKPRKVKAKENQEIVQMLSICLRYEDAE